jgi:hypothetical protein
MNGEDRRRFAEIEQKIDLYGERLARIEEQNKNQYYLLNDIHRKLFGNGQEGIITTLTKHKVYFAILGGAIIVLSTAFLNYIFKFF